MKVSPELEKRERKWWRAPFVDWLPLGLIFLGAGIHQYDRIDIVLGSAVCFVALVALGSNILGKK